MCASLGSTEGFRPRNFVKSDERNPACDQEWSFDQVAIASKQGDQIGNRDHPDFLPELEPPVVAPGGVAKAPPVASDGSEHRFKLDPGRGPVPDGLFGEREFMTPEPLRCPLAATTVSVGVDF